MIPQRQPFHPEVSEFMVRTLNGHVTPALTASPGSGVVFEGLTNRWVAEHSDRPEIDFDEIYKSCLDAQRSLVSTANKLCKKRGLPCLDGITCHSWTEVEESVSDACSVLEELAIKDQNPGEGVTGKLKSGFRSLCKNAGVGTSIVSLVPNDTYTSILCGGLKIIFTALQQTGQCRQEVLKALENIPFILSDHAALVKLNRPNVEVHRRAAALYGSLFRLMEVIISWFLKSSIKTGARMVFNPSSFSDGLKDAQEDVKLAVQRFNMQMTKMATETQEYMQQQNYEIIYMQGQSMHMQNENSREIIGSIKELSSRLGILESLTPFLNQQQEEMERRRESLLSRRRVPPRLTLPKVSVDEILEMYLHEPDLVHKDSEAIRRLQFRAGCEVDEDRIVAIQAHPRFQSWLTLNESSLLLLNANSDAAPNMEMSIVGARTFQRALDVSEEQTHGTTILIPLAFFCSQHRDFRRDENGTPEVLAMSILLQLLDQYRDFDHTLLATVVEDLDPEDIQSICTIVGALISGLPKNIIVILIVDGLRFFTHPVGRQDGMREVIEHLVEIQRSDVAATLKFLFANSTRSDFVEDLFTDDEKLKMPRDVNGIEGYNTLLWKRPVALGTRDQQLDGEKSEFY